MRLYRETGAALKETGATNYNALQSFLFPSCSLSIPFSLYLSLFLSYDDYHRGLGARELEAQMLGHIEGAVSPAHQTSKLAT